MKKWMAEILDSAKLRGADYADIRTVRRQLEEIEVKNGSVEALTRDEEFGFGIRLLYRGAWGFACSSKVTKQEMESVLGKALKIARASSTVPGKPVSFPPMPPVVDRYQTPYVIDPLDVPIETKLNLLLAADAILRKGKKVKLSEAFTGSYRTEKSFASTEGSWIEQVIVECGAGMTATAIEGDEIQVRSYPNSFRGNLPPEGTSM